MKTIVKFPFNFFLLDFPLIKLKILQEGNILVVDPISHDAVKIDSKLNKLGRIKGIPIPQR